MELMEYLIAQLDRETARSRRALEQVPEGAHNWKPHDKSMIFGYLSQLVANIPSWFAMIVTLDELDIAPKGGPQHKQDPLNTSAEYLRALDKASGAAHEALRNTNEAHLRTPWRLLAGGTVVVETSREEMIQDTFLHWAHHRGQMTVYLRLMGATVPALYGPSADENRF